MFARLGMRIGRRLRPTAGQVGLQGDTRTGYEKFAEVGSLLPERSRLYNR